MNSVSSQVLYNEYVVPRTELITWDIPTRFPKWTGQSLGDALIVGYISFWHFGMPIEMSYVFDQTLISAKVKTFRDALSYCMTRLGDINELQTRLINEGMLDRDCVVLHLRPDMKLEFSSTDSTFTFIASSLMRSRLPSGLESKILEWLNHFFPMIPPLVGAPSV